MDDSDIYIWTSYILLERVNIYQMSLSSITYSIKIKCDTNWSKQYHHGYTCWKIHWTTWLPYMLFCLKRLSHVKQLKSYLIFSKKISIWFLLYSYTCIYIYKHKWHYTILITLIRKTLIPWRFYRFLADRMVQNILLKMKNDMCIYSVGQTRKLARMT